MSLSFLSKLYESLIVILFPHSKQEQGILKLCGSFPLYISTHKLVDKKSRRFFQVTALSDYGDRQVSLLIQSLKYNRNKESVNIISSALGEYLLEVVSNYNTVHPGKPLLIVPIPLSKKRLKKRGFNQIEVLLERVVKNYPDLKEYVQTDILIKHRETKSQTHLKRKERLLNVKDSFRVKATKCGRFHLSQDVILIDDVLTTGATALEASKALIKAGAGSVSIVVVARTL